LPFSLDRARLSNAQSARDAVLRRFVVFVAGLRAVDRGSDRADASVPGEVTVALNRGSGARTGDPPILGSRNPNRPLVVIDAGHGGHDPGATSVHDGGKEKDIVLDSPARCVTSLSAPTGCASP
jgi:N-acetylmuramoyl-L-alanine amidase